MACRQNTMSRATQKEESVNALLQYPPLFIYFYAYKFHSCMKANLYLLCRKNEKLQTVLDLPLVKIIPRLA